MVTFAPPHCATRVRESGLHAHVVFTRSTGLRLLVRGLREGGLADEWNTVHPDSAIGPEDEIVEVNGVREDARHMLDSCIQSACLRIVFVKADPNALSGAFTAVLFMARHLYLFSLCWEGQM